MNDLLHRSVPELDGMGLQYLESLKALLTASVYEESAWRLIEPKARISGLRDVAINLLIGILKKSAIHLVKEQPFDPRARMRGQDQPLFSFTMIGRMRLDNIQGCIERVVIDGVPGDFVECGAWRGGACIFARAVLKALGVVDRKVWVADSFEGMPKLTIEKDKVDPDLSARQYLNVSLEQVKRNFEKFDLLDDQVEFVKGWFSSSLPSAPIKSVSVLRLDGDHYSSTIDALNGLYGRLSVGGFVIIDDYNWPGCRSAVTEFRSAHRINAPIQPIDDASVFWRREVP